MARVRVAIAVIENQEGQVLIAQRKNNVHQAGMWEFPGGKLELNETPHIALARELEEELAINSIESVPLIDVFFDYPDIEVQLHVRVVECYSGEPIGHESQTIKWVDKKYLADYPFPEANKAILTSIALGREYAIINSSDISDVLLQLQNVASQNIKLVQIRAKELLAQQSNRFFAQINKECALLGVKYLVNSGGIMCPESSAGVHLTSNELMRLKNKPTVNGYVAASCHNIEELKQAEKLDLDFVVLSPVKETASHPDAELLGWQHFERLVAQINIPVFALGGIKKSDLNQSIIVGSQGISGIRLFK